MCVPSAVIGSYLLYHSTVDKLWSHWNYNFLLLKVEMADDLGSRSLFLTVLEAGLMILFNTLSLFGNVLVCISVYRNTRLRTTTNIYIIALAVTDLLSAIFVMPFVTGVLITGGWPFGKTICQMHAFFSLFVVYLSPVTMGLTALNRYVKICQPHQQYRRLFSNKSSCILLASTWTLIALYLLVTRLAGFQEFRFVPGYAACLNYHLSEVGRKVHYVIVLGLFVVLPMGVTIFSYRKVFKKIREHNTDVSQGLHTPAVNTPVSSHEIQICRSLFVIVFAFMLCWLPAWLITILKRLHIVAKIPRNVELLCAFCLTLSNTINPFIYAGMNPLFRREFRRIFHCRSCQSVQAITNN